VGLEGLIDEIDQSIDWINEDMGGGFEGWLERRVLGGGVFL
jgi:hypothetical protein